MSQLDTATPHRASDAIEQIVALLRADDDLVTLLTAGTTATDAAQVIYPDDGRRNRNPAELVVTVYPGGGTAHREYERVRYLAQVNVVVEADWRDDSPYGMADVLDSAGEVMNDTLPSGMVYHGVVGGSSPASVDNAATGQWTQMVRWRVSWPRSKGE